MVTPWKVTKYGVTSGPNTEKIRTRNNSVFGHFSSSASNLHDTSNLVNSWKSDMTLQTNVVMPMTTFFGIFIYLLFYFVTIPSFMHMFTIFGIGFIANLVQVEFYRLSGNFRDTTLFFCKVNGLGEVNDLVIY